MVKIGPAEEFLGEDVLTREMRFEIFEQDIKMFWRHGGVIIPPDRLFRRGVANRELVFGRTAGVLARFDYEGATIGNARLAIGE